MLKIAFVHPSQVGSFALKPWEEIEKSSQQSGATAPSQKPLATSTLMDIKSTKLGKIKSCSLCGKDFITKSFKHSYCSKKCQYDQYRTTKEAEEIPVICTVCSAPFTVKALSVRTCCSSKCSGILRSLNRK